MKINSINQSNYGYSVQNNNQCRPKPAFGSIVRNDVPQEVMKNVKKVIISGPSGVGKGVILKAFSEKFKGFFSPVVSCTTRKARPGEIDGINYNFISPEQFKNGIENNEFLEYVNVYGDKFYGTRKADVEKATQNGGHALLEIDVDGAQKVKSKLDDVVSIFIKPKSIDLLKEHLSRRGTETAETLSQRISRAAYEIEAGSDPKRYDIVIQNNDDIAENVQDLAKVFNLA